MAELLDLAAVDAFYGDSHILHSIDLRVAEGEGVAILGRNGAGKSTLLKSVLAAGPSVRGTIRFDGQDLAGMPTFRRTRLGLSLVPEDRRIFPHITVAENLAIGRYGARAGVEPRSAVEIGTLFPMIAPLLQRRGYQMSGGQQQMVAIGRGMVSRPRLLMLDEPAEGLAPVIVDSLAGEIARLRGDRGLSLIVTEQNTEFARTCTDKVFVLDSGQVVFGGTWNDFDAQPELQTLYLAA